LQILFSLISLFPAFLTVTTCQFQQPSPEDEACLQSAFEKFLRSMNQKIIPLMIPGREAELQLMTEYMQTVVSSRRFYQTMWSKPLSSDQWETFCK
jgi:hypothetical protein